MTNCPHRLVVPFTALLAVVITVVLFKLFFESVYIAAFISFCFTVIVGLVFKPLLGE